MGLLYQVCYPPGVGPTTSWEDRVKIADLQPVSSSFTDYRRQIGRGQAVLPNGYERLSEVIDVDAADHSNDVASLIQVIRPAEGLYPQTLVAQWLVNSTPDELTESELIVNGAGVEQTMDWAIVEPWDWDGTVEFVSQFPDHIYGGRNVLVEPTAECEPRISEFWTDATSGQWRVNVDGDTVDIDFDATASEVTTAYESLSTVTDVRVEGNGSADTPWRVTFITPCTPTTTYTVTTNTLNSPIRAGLIQQGGIVPGGWTVSKPLFGNTEYGTYSDFGFGTPPSAPPCGGDAIFFDGDTPVGFSFPGVQTTPSVKAGGLYQASVWVYVDAAGSFPMRLVLRAPSEEPLIDSSTWPSTSVPGQTWTEITIPDVEMPDWAERIIFRVAYVGTANPPDIWVACPELREGMAPATVGQIMLDLLDDAQTDHAGRDALLFINADFDATNDTSGTPWPRDESVNIQRGQTYRRVLDSVFGRLGYEWDLEPSTNAGEWDLRIWQQGTRGTDHTAQDSPAMLIGQGTRRASASTALPRGNAVTVEGAAQQFYHDEESGSITAIGRREAYEGDITYVENLDEWATQILARFMDEGFAPNFDVVDGPWPVPGVAYDLADTMTVTTGVRRVSRQVESRGFTETDADGLVWTVQYGQAQFGGPVTSGVSSGFSGGYGGLGAVGPVAEGVRRLIEKLDRLPDRDQPTALLTGEKGGAPTIVVAPSNSSDFSKNKADFIMVGDAGIDSVTMNKVLDLLNAAASNTGGRLLITEGTLNLSDTFNATFQGVIEGMGPGQTIINASGFTAGNPVLEMTGTGGAIRDLSIQGAGTSIAAASFFGRIENVYISNSGAAGIEVDGGSVVTIEGCYIEASSGAGVIVGGNYVNITDCWIYGGAGHAVEVDGGPDHVRIAKSSLLAESGWWGFTTESGFNCSFITIEGCEFHNSGASGGIRLNGIWQKARLYGNSISVASGPAIQVIANFSTVFSPELVIASNSVEDCTQGIVLTSTGSENARGAVISGNAFTTMGDGTSISVSDWESSSIAGNTFVDLDRDGIVLTDVSDSVVRGNILDLVGTDTTDTYDMIRVAGDRNLVTNNKLRPGTGPGGQLTRYGVNVASGTFNMVVGNDLEDPASYGSDALNDSGTNTQLTYPADATYGDNFTT